MSNITDQELDRDIRNLYIPLEDRHIPLASWEELEKIYGKGFVNNQKREIEKEKKTYENVRKRVKT